MQHFHVASLLLDIVGVRTDDELFSTHRHAVARPKLFATSHFDDPNYQNAARLNQVLGLTAGLANLGELKKLVQLNRFFVGLA